MARIRTIKPEFFTSEDIVELEPLARLLYIALWCEADKEGRLAWKPKTFKMRYLPADDVDVDEICDALLDAGLVVLYGDGLAYIPTFRRHQHVNPRESVSTLPAPEDCPPSLPKRITPSVRAEVFDRDGHTCLRCGSKEKLTIDHILPQCLGGPHIQENLRVLCKSCNSARPVSGQAFIDDLAKDGLSIDSLRTKFGIDASGRVMTRENQELTRREEGRERKGKEGKGKEGNSRVDDAPPAAEDKPPKKSPAIERPEDVDEQTWADWLQLRKTKKAPVTETVLKQARNESEKAGISLEAFLQIWCARGSQGLQADWIKPQELQSKRNGATGRPSINDFSDGGDDDPFATMRRTL